MPDTQSSHTTGLQFFRRTSVIMALYGLVEHEATVHIRHMLTFAWLMNERKGNLSTP